MTTDLQDSPVFCKADPMPRLQHRKSTSWRKRAFLRLVIRDGAFCALCKNHDSKIVRKGGISGSFFDGTLHCISYITSSLEVEHKLPLSEGGTNDDINLQLVCHSCHKTKTSIERSNRLKQLFAEWRASQ
jgi:5-methylcytosine-specific restriction endonuclease McrA